MDERPHYEPPTLYAFLQEAAWSLGTRCQILAFFAQLGDRAGCDYASRQITAEAKAIASAVQMLLKDQKDGEGPG